MRKKFLVFCCAAALAVSAAGCSPAEKAPAQETQTEQQTEAPETEESSQEAEGSAQEMAAAPQTVKFYGTVTRPEGSEGDQLLMNAAIEGVEGQQEVILNISEETLILDAVEGLPIKLEDIKDGDMVYSYMSPAMTAQPSASVLRLHDSGQYSGRLPCSSSGGGKGADCKRGRKRSGGSCFRHSLPGSGRLCSASVSDEKYGDNRKPDRGQKFPGMV